MPRYPNAGQVATATNRRTKTQVSVYIAADAMLDDAAGPYAVVCETHGTIANTATKTRALAFMRQPWQHCDDCRAILAYHDCGNDACMERVPADLAFCSDTCRNIYADAEGIYNIAPCPRCRYQVATMILDEREVCPRCYEAIPPC